jgi:hypothetical protein
MRAELEAGRSSKIITSSALFAANPAFGRAVACQHLKARARSTHSKRITAMSGVSGYLTIMAAYTPGGKAAYPADAAAIAFWLSYICGDGVTVDTAEAYLAAVRAAHLEDSLEWLPREFERKFVKDHMTALRNIHGAPKPRERQLVNPLALHLFCARLPSSSHKWRLFKLAAHIMSYRGRRGGECFTVSTEFPKKHLRAKNLIEQNVPPGHRLFLDDTKNHKGEDYSVFYPRLGDSTDLAPLLADYRGMSPVPLRDDDFLLLKEDGKPLDAATFYRWTAEAFNLVGLTLQPNAKIGASSFRAGVATEAARIDFKTERIQQLGDWKAKESIDAYVSLNDFDVVDSVTRLANEARLNAAAITELGLRTQKGAAMAARLIPARASAPARRARPTRTV